MPSKYLSIFLKALEMPLINCEINLNLAWSENCVIRYAIGEKKIKITDIKLLLYQFKIMQMLEQLKSGFKRTINRNKY